MEAVHGGVVSGPVDKVVRQLVGECGGSVPYGHLVTTVARCADDLHRLTRRDPLVEVDPDDFAAVLEDLARGRLAAVAPAPPPRDPQL